MSPERIQLQLDGTHRIVVKVGTRLLVSEKESFDRSRVRVLVDQLAALRSQGLEIILVSSGAVGAGMKVRGLKRRPKDLASRQALAAIGQALLVHEYERRFEKHQIQVAQVLLSVSDLDDRRRFLNASRTLNSLLAWGVVPIVNENDSVAVDELRFGDNDYLAAVVAAKVSADLLILLTDVDGLYDRNPKDGGQLIRIVDRFSREVVEAGKGPGGETSMGGMRTKVEAARLATDAGKPAIIANGRRKNILVDLLHGQGIGTWFLPTGKRLRGRKTWLALAHAVAGGIAVDAGAAKVVRSDGKSLLPIGVTAVLGEFRRGDLIRVVGPDQSEVARGLAGLSSAEVANVKGLRLNDIAAKFGDALAREVIHRDNLVLTRTEGD